MTQLYHVIYGENSKSLILLIAWLPSAVSLASLPFIKIIKSTSSIPHQNDLKVFYHFLYISLALAASLMAIIIAQIKHQFTKIEYISTTSIVILFLLLPLFVAINQELKVYKQPRQENTIVVVVTDTALPNQGSTNWFKNIFKPPRRGEDYTILQAVFSVDMAILFVATTCGVGGALAVVDNLGQIGTSLSYPSHSIAIFVSLMSIWNFLGRVFSGYLSEFLLHKFPRPLMLSFVILLSCLGHLLIAFAAPNALYFASMIIGFCLGAQIPLTATIISEIFGLKHYSTLYNIGSVSSPIGSYIFNVKIAGHLYDKEGERQIKNLGLKKQYEKEFICKGVSWYRTSFFIMATAAILGFLVSLILVFRTRSFYKGDIYHKFSEERKEEGIQQRVPRREDETSNHALSTI